MTVLALDCTVVALQGNPIAAGVPANAGSLLIWNGSSWVSSGNVVVDGASVVPSVDNTCVLGASGQAWSNITTYALDNISDPRIKRNISEISPMASLAAVMQVHPARFNWKNDPEGFPQRLGFLSTEVNAALHRVSTNGVQTVRPLELIALLWAAVQELRTEIVDLRRAVLEIR